MRKFLIPAVAALAVVTVEVAPTIAQSDGPTKVEVDASVSPNNGGSKKKPQGHTVKAKITVTTSPDVDKPVVEGGEVYFPKGALYNGKKFASCSKATISRGGPDACPKKSIMGKGSGSANADTVETAPKVVVVNGGKSTVWFYTTLQRPARVRAPVEGKISKASGQWALKLSFKVPEVLQSVAGIPVTLNDLTVTAGGKSWAKDWLATTSCGSGGKWPFEAHLNLSTGQTVQYTDSVTCKK
jgi:hypothetical protein